MEGSVSESIGYPLQQEPVPGSVAEDVLGDEVELAVQGGNALLELGVDNDGQHSVAPVEQVRVQVRARGKGKVVRAALVRTLEGPHQQVKGQEFPVLKTIK